MHPFFSMMFSLLAIIGHVSGQSDRPYRSELKVKNGGPWGSWGSKSMCPIGSYAAGFNLKVERPGGDDTALNGIRLYCVDRSKESSSQDKYPIQSGVGEWGRWLIAKWCSSGYLTSFQLRVESPQGSGDDTAANSIKFTCSGGSGLQGDSTNWGDWGDWSPTCGTGICGIQTRIEESQGIGDDTALNDVIMFCCD